MADFAVDLHGDIRVQGFWLYCFRRRAGILPVLRKQYILKSCTLMSQWRSTAKSAIVHLLFIDFTGEYY